MAEIPLHAKVQCLDGHCGESVTVIVDRKTLQVTHFVIQGGGLDTPRLVPVDQITATDADAIHLNCRKQQVADFPPFVEREYVASEKPDRDSVSEGMYTGSSVIPSMAPGLAPMDIENIPEGEVAVRRGLNVEASDGHIGRVDDLVTDAGTGAITHLVFREGHFWGRREVIVPLTAMEHFDGDTVYLKLSRKEIEELPRYR